MPASGIELSKTAICVQLCTENECKRPTLVADLTNFPFEYFMPFSHNIPLYLLNTSMQSQKWAKTQIKGGGRRGGYCLKTYLPQSTALQSLRVSWIHIRQCTRVKKPNLTGHHVLCEDRRTFEQCIVHHFVRISVELATTFSHAESWPDVESWP